MNTTLKRQSFPLADVSGFQQKMLNWLRPSSIFCYLDNRHYTLTPHRTECLVAVGAVDFVSGKDIGLADDFIKRNDWVFGHLSYGLKDYLHALPSLKRDRIGFPPFYFFTPQVLLEIKGETVYISSEAPQNIFDEINEQARFNDDVLNSFAAPQPVLSREEYIEKIRSLQAHIKRGDCYEINFCQEFFTAGAIIDPFLCFEKLMEVSPNPFSAFYRLHDKYLLCASPERFLLKEGKRLLSQPMKGTAKRDLTSVEGDEKLKHGLHESQKEQAENVMIVDLVRNDLTRVCKEGSVGVNELFGIHSFPQVHQMVSTISGEVKDDVSFSQIIKATFPMGSMTGAPKHRVMQLIDEYEPTARGIFSGAVGYINSAGDFDFNVVIRSLMFNDGEKILSYQVGSGITFYSDPEKEWEECMLKAEAIRKVLT